MSLIFKSALGITTGLLMFIWFVNALTYYGEVLLTTTVSSDKNQRSRILLNPTHRLKVIWKTVYIRSKS